MGKLIWLVLLLPLGLAACKKSAEEQLADRLMGEAAKKAGQVDLKKVEAEANRLKDHMSDSEKAKAREALRKLQERL